MRGAPGGPPRGPPVVDGYLTPVRADRREAYRRFAARMGEVWRDHGALRVVETWGAPRPQAQAEFHAEGAPMPAGAPDLRAAGGAAEGEVLVLSWVEWPDRATRDRAVAAVRTDPRVTATLDEEPVFEGARALAGTFELLLDA